MRIHLQDPCHNHGRDDLHSFAKYRELESAVDIVRQMAARGRTPKVVFNAIRGLPGAEHCNVRDVENLLAAARKRKEVSEHPPVPQLS